MKITHRLTAAAVAVGTTFSIVWAMAALGYPDTARAAPILLAQAGTCR